MNLTDYERAVRESRVIYVNGQINLDLVANVRKQVAEFLKEPAREEVVVTVSSWGGDSTQALNLYHDLTALGHQRKLWLVCQSTVGSMATYLICAVPKERRFAFPMCNFYCHRCKMNYNTTLEGNADLHRYRLKEYAATIENFEQEENKLIHILARSTGMAVEQVVELLDNPRHIYEEEALNLGFVSGILKEGN